MEEALSLTENVNEWAFYSVLSLELGVLFCVAWKWEQIILRESICITNSELRELKTEKEKEPMQLNGAELSLSSAKEQEIEQEICCY